MRPFRIAFAAVSALAFACTPGEPLEVDETASPLIGGTVDSGDPAVVALSTGGTTSFCTGALISPSVVLTAAHCIDMAGSDPNIIAFFGTDLAGEGTRIGIARKEQHLNWSGNVGQFDIGMLLLNFPQDPELPLPLNTSPATNHIGDDYRHVGFGVFDRDTMAADGKKRQGTTTISNTSGTDVILSGDANLSVCFGDSGGPAFLTVDGEERVAGVHSFTSGSQCNPPNGDTRVDVYAQDFVLPWIQENDPVCRRDNVCSRIGCLDDPDCEPCGADGTCTSECALPDPDCPISGIGEICQVDTQCTEGFCVFWTGDNDYHFCSEECSSDGDCPSGMTCQNVMPFGDICYFEEDPPGVMGDDCTEPTDCGTYVCEESTCTRACDLSVGLDCPTGFTCEAGGDGFFCFPVGDDGGGGGCSTTGSDSGAPVLVLIAAALLVWRRRRSF